MLSCLFAIVLFISSTPIFQGSEPNHVTYKQNQESQREDQPAVELNDITTEDNFGSQMNAILQDFPNQFTNIKGGLWSESDTFQIPRLHCHIRLGLAVYTYIQEEQPSRHATFQANFPGSTVPDFAVQSYSQLKGAFEYYIFPCGSFDRGEEIVDGNKRAQFYHIRVADDKSNLAFEKMLVEIGIEQGQTFVGSGYESTVWVPFVKVYEKG
jgi:hypothetical protein